jgi:hypothetical protein
MKLFARKKAELDPKLFGMWCIQAEPGDIPEEDATTEFLADGSMIVTNHEKKTTRSTSNYRVECGFIISTSEPPIRSTKKIAYRIEDDGSLVLHYDKWETRHIRLK